MYEDALRRYRQVLTALPPRLTDAMSWTVVVGQTNVESVVRRLGGDPVALVERRPLDDDFEHDEGQSHWYVDGVDGAVALLEVNRGQARRPVVLQRLSGRSNQAFSACWDIEADSAFSYAAAAAVVTVFDGEDPLRRSGTEPDALEAEYEPLWAAAGDSWRAAMLTLVELRTGVRFDASWSEQPHPVLITAVVPDDPPGPAPNNAVFALLEQRTNLRRDAALAWLTQTLADRFDLNDPALARAIDARRAHRRVDEETKRQVRDMTRLIHQQVHARDKTVPQHSDPVWRRGQAAMAAVMVMDFSDPWIFLLHAENALADDWPQIVPHLRARL